MGQKELIKGMLKPLLLKLLEENGRMYGYEMTRKVEELTKGNIVLTFGALYPILHKLEKEGVVVTEIETVNNRARVYYQLTKSGRKSALEKIAELEDFVRSLGQLLTPSSGFSPCN